MYEEIINFNDSDFLTEKRFCKTHSETKEFLEKVQNSYNPNLINKVENEDTQILIKYRTYKKSKKQLIISFFLILLGFIFGNTIPLFYFVLIMGFIIFISSFFGMIMNRLSDDKIKYINN